jgi:hypothetical protein
MVIEEAQRDAPDAAPSQTREPEEARVSWARTMRPEAVPIISRAVPEKELLRAKKPEAGEVNP